MGEVAAKEQQKRGWRRTLPTSNMNDKLAVIAALGLLIDGKYKEL